MKKGDGLFKKITLFPITVYALLLILLPIIYILFLSFCKNDSYGGIIYSFTLSNYRSIFDITYIKIFLKSSMIALIATFLCICISYPFALVLRERSKNVQNLMTKLIMIPFLTNSLIRTYGWIVLLRKNGIINSGLINIGILSDLHLFFLSKHFITTAKWP